MKRHQHDPRGAATSMFPFLAVLLCTMGALVVLLIVIARQARLDHTVPPVVLPDDSVRIALEDIEWRISQLRAMRQDATEQLSQARARLSHFEQQAREARDEVARLREQQQQLQNAAGQEQAQDEALTQRLRDLQSARDTAAAELDRLEQQRRQTPRSYAIIPYFGKLATHRRPVYIECRDDGIILQPEGVTLRASDFGDPSSPVNPLALAMRATREHYHQRHGATFIQNYEPYPFLLVRPDGIGAFYVAREALGAWQGEFGYELVETDWKLDYPPEDPELARIQQVALEESRLRQRMLARAAPRLYPGGQPGGSEETFAIEPERQTSGSGSGGFSGSSFPSRGNFASRGSETGGGELGGGSSTPSSGNFASTGNASQGGAAGQAGSTGESGTGSEASAADSQSLADRRGANWALPSAAAKTFPLVRPVRLQCDAGQVVVLPDSDQHAPQVVELGARTESSIDDLVSAIWKQTDRWGIAGQGLYWRPEIVVQVLPGGESRFADLHRLLDGSGLTVRRSNLQQASRPASAGGQRTAQ